MNRAVNRLMKESYVILMKSCRTRMTLAFFRFFLCDWSLRPWGHTRNGRANDSFHLHFHGLFLSFLSVWRQKRERERDRKWKVKETKWRSSSSFGDIFWPLCLLCWPEDHVSKEKKWMTVHRLFLLHQLVLRTVSWWRKACVLVS